MANILYISLTGMTESLGESQVVQYLLELAKNNSIFLFSFERPDNQKKIFQISKILNNANIQWKYTEYSNRLGLLSTFWQTIVAYYFLSKLIKKEKIQIVHARSLVPAVIGLILKKTCKAKLLFDIRGFAIDEKIMDGRLKETSILTRLLKKLELIVYKNSDHVVTLTHVSKPLIAEKYNVKPKDISVIPTCANLNLFKTISRAEKLAVKESLGYLQKDIIILRNGSLNNSYDLDAEFKLFEHLMLLDKNVKLLFLNKGQHGLIQYHLDKHKVGKEKYKIFSIDFEAVAQYINIADLCIFFVKPTFAKQASAPTKFAEIVACHLPSVTNTQYGDMGYYFNSYKVGVLLDLEDVHSDSNKAANKVIKLLEQSRSAPANYYDFDKLVKDHFSKKIAVERYQLIYSKLIRNDSL